MPRIEIAIPERLPFRCELDVLIGHVNSARHVGNDAVIGLCNEARFRFLNHCGFVSPHVDGTGLINADLAAIYKSEAHYGERLIFDVGVGELLKYGAEFVYRISCAADNRLIAIVKTTMLLFDYNNKCLVPASTEFHQRLRNADPSGANNALETHHVA